MTAAVAPPKLPSKDLAYDPILPLRESANYLGFRGKDPVKSLRRLKLERHAMPGTGRERPRFGHRLSDLNAYLAQLNDPASRIHLRKSA